MQILQLPFHQVVHMMLTIFLFQLRVMFVQELRVLLIGITCAKGHPYYERDNATDFLQHDFKSSQKVQKWQGLHGTFGQDMQHINTSRNLLSIISMVC
jgi:hypothetical protein